MRPKMDLLSTGLIENKNFNNLQTAKIKSTKQSFENFLINNRKEVSKLNKEQSLKEHNPDVSLKTNNSEIAKKFAAVSKFLVKSIQQNETNQRDLKAKDIDLDESELVVQISELAELIQQLTQQLQFVNSSQDEDIKGTDDQLSKNISKINELLNVLDNIDENYPVIKEMLAGVLLNNNELIIQGLMSNELTSQELMSDELTSQELMSNELTSRELMKNELTSRELMKNELTSQEIMSNELTSKNQTVNVYSTLDQTIIFSNHGKDELANVLSKLAENFKALISVKDELKNSLNNNLSVKEILTNVDEIISSVQPKLNLLEKIPSFLEKIAVQNEESIETDGNIVIRIIPEEFTKNLESQKDHPKSIEIPETKKSSDKTNLVLDDEQIKSTIQHPIINNEFINKRQLNMQEIQNISKNQFTQLNQGNALDQLVQKATLMVKEGFSEMKMQLKPDFLGKVDLQISIEKGIVTAKFAAESQQVKELIEANLSNLKQNLANQGLKIDQISVTIGNQQNLNDQSRRPNQQTNSRNTKKFKLEEGEVYGAILSNELESITKHWYSDSTVDYTA